ncbi:YigZ family protein [Methanogenium sp. S4BF]|uniref:YigZ family protein n=1 Tax=Methanogenium sp. S4BF TaxID=1789226 RepID=UPI002417CEC4|nr:YigZ family protein [Methanogenium sp. S4BF]WFN34970.1 YigZ family protein [Methanogenium sp. S4BF]
MWEEKGAALLVVKMSRFYAHLYAVSSVEDVQEVREQHRKVYRKAAHHCYAARLTSPSGCQELFGSDGEVGRPGQVLLQMLQREEFSSHLIVVSRIFGGIKLGPGNVSRAFRDAAAEAVAEAVRG